MASRLGWYRTGLSFGIALDNKRQQKQRSVETGDLPREEQCVLTGTAVHILFRQMSSVPQTPAGRKSHGQGMTYDKTLYRILCKCSAFCKLKLGCMLQVCFTTDYEMHHVDKKAMTDICNDFIRDSLMVLVPLRRAPQMPPVLVGSEHLA